MSEEILYCFRFSELPGSAGVAGEVLPALELDFSCYEDLENRTTFYTVYSPDEEARTAALDLWKQTLEQWRELGLECSEPECFTLRRSEWADAWKKFFTPIEISPRLLVKPSWVERAPLPGQRVLTLDPGMSFGTGQHATTLYCLQQIDRFAGEGGAMLDAGCGSGILAIAAALLGYSPIDAFDFDPDAVRVANENLEINGVSGAVHTEVGDAADYAGRPEGYDLVCANILGHLLIAYSRNIVRWVKPSGRLALAGILNVKFDEVSACYAGLGFREVERVTLREWTSGLFVRA